MAAVSCYQEQRMGLVTSNKEAVLNHIRIDHMSTYGLCKGSATVTVSGTTPPPPISSIARRGEWSMFWMYTGIFQNQAINIQALIQQVLRLVLSPPPCRY